MTLSMSRRRDVRVVPARREADVRALISEAYHSATELLQRLERLARIDAGRMLLWRQVAMVTRRVRHAIGRLQPREGGRGR